jgi:hypothetical protein
MALARKFIQLMSIVLVSCKVEMNPRRLLNGHQFLHRIFKMSQFVQCYDVSSYSFVKFSSTSIVVLSWIRRIQSNPFDRIQLAAVFRRDAELRENKQRSMFQAAAGPKHFKAARDPVPAWKGLTDGNKQLNLSTFFCHLSWKRCWGIFFLHAREGRS